MKTNKTILFASSSILAAGMAQGAVVINTINQTVNTSSSGYSFDLNGDSVNDFSVFFDANNNVKPCVLGTVGASNPTPYVFNEMNMAANGNGTAVIPAGATITSQFSVGAYTLGIATDQKGKNEAYLYQNGENETVGQWPSDQDTIGYVGLALVDTSLGTINYGWLQLEFNGLNSTMTVLETGYETTPDTSIVTPALPVPEPTTVALTGLSGALLLMAKRKKA